MFVNRGEFTVKVMMPLEHREVKTASLCGFARLQCANLHVLCRLCASTKPRTFIYGGAFGCVGFCNGIITEGWGIAYEDKKRL